MLDRAQYAPPANLEAEQALLGAVLVSNETLDRIAGLIEPEDFSETIYQHIFATARKMHAEGKSVTPITLKPFVLEWPDIAPGLPVWKHLGNLMVAATTLINAPSYAATVRDHAARRRLYDLGSELMSASGNPEYAVSELASQAVTGLDNVLAISRARGRKAVPIGESFRDVLDGVLNDDGDDIITTGSADLDKAMSGGWRRKQYAIVAGRPSMGKTTVASSLMLRTAKAGHGVLFFSLEMPTDQVSKRALTDLAYSSQRRIPYTSLRFGQLNDTELEIIGRAGGEFSKLPIVIDDDRGLTIADIGARIRAQAQRFEKDGKRLGLVVLDHLGFIRASERYRGNRVHEVTEISAGLGQIAKENDVALIVLCQLNRGTEGRENKRPTLSDLRDSGSLEQDADVVIFTYREAYYLERFQHDPGSQKEIERQASLEAYRNTLELLISKNRNGPTSSVTVFCDMASNAIRDLAR